MNNTIQKASAQIQDIHKSLKQLELNKDQQVVPVIVAIATGTPEHILPQADAAKFVANLPSIQKNQSRIERIYQNTRIKTRHMAIDLLSEKQVEFCRQRNNIQARMDLYRELGIPLAERVAKEAISKVDCRDEIGLIVFVSSTGFVAPGVDAALIKRLGLKRNTARVTVNFMGCAAAMNGLRVAADYIRAYPKKKALVVCLELSSINAVYEDNINDVIIHSIFGDGCAAVVLGSCDRNMASGSGKISITKHLSYLIEDTEDGITLGIQDNGITCKLSRNLPNYIESGVDKIIVDFLASEKLSKADIDLWAVHPGGTKIIQKAQASLGLTDAQVAHSWEVLGTYGNMLSASVLFVMQQMFENLDNKAESEPLKGIAFSFSPGVGLEGILFEKM